MLYFHHELTLCCLGDARESWELLRNKEGGKEKNKQALNFVHSFIYF